MAKKSRKKKNYLPKRVAGMKVPKAVRRGAVGEFIASPVGQAIIAESIVHASGRVLNKQSRKGSAARTFARHPLLSMRYAGAMAGQAGRDAGRDAKQATDIVGHAFGEAARHFMHVLQNHGAWDEQSTDWGREEKSGGKTSARKRARAEQASH